MRRRVLASLAMLTVVLTAGCLAGGAGPLHPPAGPGDEDVTTRQPGSGPEGDGGGTQLTTVQTPSNVAIANHTFRQSPLSRVVLNLTVNNTGSERVRAQLVGAIRFNGSRKEAWKQVVLDAGQTRTVDIYFDVPWEAFEGNLTQARVVWTKPATAGNG